VRSALKNRACLGETCTPDCPDYVIIATLIIPEYRSPLMRPRALLGTLKKGGMNSLTTKAGS